MAIDVINYEKNFPLKNAVLNGKQKIVTLLIKLGANLYDDIALHAIRSNNVELLKILMNDPEVKLPLDIPHVKQHSFFPYLPNSFISLQMFKVCFASGLSLKNYSLADSEVLQTPEAVEYCLKRDEKLDITFGENPIRQISYKLPLPGIKGCSVDSAAACATQESLAILIAAGLNIHEKDPQGLTPLHYAAAYSNDPAVKILILAGADINATGDKGETPLHCAVKRHQGMSKNNIQCVKILLYAGADSNLQDKNNKKPSDYLSIEGYNEDL